MTKELEMIVVMARTEFIAALHAAYELGVFCAKEVNSGTRRWTAAKTARERAHLNRLLKQFGFDKLTDDEYKPFQG